MCFQVGICHKCGRFKRPSPKREDLLHLLSSQHPRIVLGDDVIQFIDQFLWLKGDMCCSLLKIFDGKHLVLVTIAVPVLMDMIAESTSDVGTVVGNWFPVQKHQHTFKIR